MRTDRLPLPPCSSATDPGAEILKLLPKLRVLALSLCGGDGDCTERAEDLVQETIMKALANMNLFEPGSNMSAWLCTILRHEFYSDYRKRRREVRDEDGNYAARLRSGPAQEGHMRFLELRRALDQLPPAHREALILVAASGHSYRDAATLCACAVGTLKSRINRARARLAILLGVPEQNAKSEIALRGTPGLAAAARICGM